MYPLECCFLLIFYEKHVGRGGELAGDRLVRLRRVRVTTQRHIIECQEIYVEKRRKYVVVGINELVILT